MSDDDQTSRIAALESRITHQELAIEDLNAALTRQWHEIDRLTRQVALLTEQFQDIGAAPGGPALPEPPPPHY